MEDFVQKMSNRKITIFLTVNHYENQFFITFYTSYKTLSVCIKDILQNYSNKDIDIMNIINQNDKFLLKIERKPI